jgi:hypothetical protein
VQPAADGFVRLAGEGGDLLGGIALMGEQNHLGTQAVARATGSPQRLLQAVELSPTRPDTQGRTHKAPPRAECGGLPSCYPTKAKPQDLLGFI